jgi:signal transduction histidine kinase
MVQIITQVDRLRRQRLTFDILTPEDRRLNGLFRNANWAHLLAPTMYDPSETASDRHLPARRYSSSEEQKRIVDDSLEILLRAMRLERSVLDGLEWSLNEITDNVLNHAAAPDGGVVQLTSLREHHQVKFVVADSGRGIPPPCVKDTRN